MTKPYKGRIELWSAVHFPRDSDPEIWDISLGYCIRGIPKGHPDFTNWIRTSAVVKHDKINRRIETLNSIYDLGEPAKG